MRHDRFRPHFTTNRLLAILVDHLGQVWIGTRHSLSQLDPATGKFIEYKREPNNDNSLSESDVGAIYEDKSGTLWFGTTAGRVFRSTNKGRNWTPYATGIPPNWSIPSLAFSDARNGMMVGVDSITFRYAGIAKTNDGGVTWQVVPMTLVSASFNVLPLLTAIPNKNEKTYLLGTENQTSTIAIGFLTLDNGNGWYALDKNINSHGASEFISPQIGWIGNGYVNNAANSTTMFKWDDLGLFSPTAEPYDNTFFSVSPNPVP